MGKKAGDEIKTEEEREQAADLFAVYTSRENKALFDARVFSIPKDEVCNCLIWRQQDAIRNSIEAVGQAFFSQRELHKKPERHSGNAVVKVRCQLE